MQVTECAFMYVDTVLLVYCVLSDTFIFERVGF
jgi:hypothetical protein